MKPKLYTSLILILLVSGMALAGPGDLDTTFAGAGKSRIGFNSGDDVAKAAATQADGKLLVAGSTPNGTGGEDFLVLRYNMNGSLDTTFDGDGKALTAVGHGADRANAIAVQADGRIVVAGVCSGQNDDYCLVRYNPDGSIDTTFGLGGKVMTAVTTSWDQINAVGIQPSGKIIVVGQSMTNNASNDIVVIRYNSNGSVDNTFNFGSGKILLSPSSGDDIGTGIAMYSDGRFIVVGSTHHNTTYNDFIVARFQEGGTSDTSWGNFGIRRTDLTHDSFFKSSDTPNAIAIRPDGKVVVVGHTTTNTSPTQFAIVRYDSAGNPDSTFNGSGVARTSIGSGSAFANAVMVSTGVIQRTTVAGYTYSGGTTDIAIARYNNDGQLDPLFNGTGKLVTQLSNGDDRAHAVVPHGGLLAVAGSTFNGHNSDVAVLRYLSDGTPDMQFDEDGKRTEDPGLRGASPKGILVQPDGKAVVAGTTGSDADGDDFAIARYTASGALDPTFGGGDGRVTTDFRGTSDVGASVAIQPDGKLVVAGSSRDDSANSNDFAVARYNTDGSPDTSFNGTGRLIFPVGPLDDAATGVAIQPDGKIVVGGAVQITETNYDFGVLRLNTNGTPDATFQSGGKVIVPIGLGEDRATAIAVQSDSKILIAGTAHNGTNNDFAIARLTTTGQLDNVFGSFGRQITPISTSEDLCYGMTLQPDGKAVLVGYSYITPSDADVTLVRYTTAGQLDSSFDNDGKVTTPIGLSVEIGTSVAMQQDGKILASGAVVIGTGVEYATVRYHPNGLVDDTYGLNGKAVVDVSGFQDIAWATAVDSAGRAIVAGDAHGLFGVIRLQGDLSVRQAPFDFDGDSKTDVSIFRPGVGQWWLTKSSDSSSYVAQFGVATDHLTPADFTGDGKADIAFFRPSDGHWYVLRSENGSFFAFPFGTNGDIPVPADYDGDGKADPAVFRPSQSTWYIQRSGDNGTTIAQFGSPGDQPVPADYDGDGKTDIAIRRPSNGQWWLNRSSAGVIAHAFGTGTDRTVPGDYTGDGKADVAVWRPSTGVWFVLRSEDHSFFGFPFGTTGDIPSPGDYDGDGKTDATVFRPNGSVWFLNKTSGGVSIFQFGSAGDQPVPNAFVK